MGVYFVVGFIVLLSSALAQPVPDPTIQQHRPTQVSLKNDREKISYVVHYVQARVPGIFEQAIQYGRDLFELLDKQTKIEIELQENPRLRNAYQALLQERSPYIQMKIESKQEQVTVLRTLDPKVIPEWRKNLLEALARLQHLSVPGDSFALSLNKAIIENAKYLRSRKSYQILKGLIDIALPVPQDTQAQSLIIAERKKMYRLPAEKQIEFLEEKLPDVDLSKFGFSKNNISKEGRKFASLSKREALEYVNDVLKREAFLTSLCELHFLLQNDAGNISGSIEENRLKIENISEAQQNVFKDPKSFSIRLEALAKQISSLYQSRIKDLIHDHFDEIATKTVETISKISGVLLIEEIDPRLATLRGYIGDDCSTKWSFETVNSPKERVFFIYELVGGVKVLRGYAEGAMVERRTESGVGSKRFYLNTINGPRLTGADVLAIIHGFHESRDALKVEGIHLSVDEQIDRLNNFSSSIEAFRALTKGRPKEPIHYSSNDRTVRTYLSSQSEHDYDSISNNEYAVPYAPEVSQIPMVMVTQREYTPEPFTPKEVSKAEALFLALDLMEIGRADSVERIKNAIKFEAKDLQKLQLLLANSDRLPLGEYAKMLAQELQEMGTSIAVEQERRPIYFLEGQIRAKDAFDPAHASESIQKTISLLRVRPSALVRTNVLSGRRALFERDKNFQDFITELISKILHDTATPAITVLVQNIFLRTSREEPISAKLAIPSIHKILTQIKSLSDRRECAYFLEKLGLVLKITSIREALDNETALRIHDAWLTTSQMEPSPEEDIKLLEFYEAILVAGLNLLPAVAAKVHDPKKLEASAKSIVDFAKMDKDRRHKVIESLFSIREFQNFDKPLRTIMRADGTDGKVRDLLVIEAYRPHSNFSAEIIAELCQSFNGVLSIDLHSYEVKESKTTTREYLKWKLLSIMLSSRLNTEVLDALLSDPPQSEEFKMALMEILKSNKLGVGVGLSERATAMRLLFEMNLTDAERTEALGLLHSHFDFMMDWQSHDFERSELPSRFRNFFMNLAMGKLVRIERGEISNDFVQAVEQYCRPPQETTQMSATQALGSFLFSAKTLDVGLAGILVEMISKPRSDQILQIQAADLLSRLAKEFQSRHGKPLFKKIAEENPYLLNKIKRFISQEPPNSKVRAALVEMQLECFRDDFSTP